MSRDLGQQTAARLAREWSAPRAAAQLQPEQLQALAGRFKGLEPPALAGRFEGLEPLVKARTLLAGTFSRPEALAACREQLSSLAAQAQTDDDEWVRVIGRAVGNFSGRLDLDAVVSESRLVSGTMAELNRLLDDNPPCPDFRPLEELYLSQRAAAARSGGAPPRQHAHFRLRHAPAATSTADVVAAALPSVPSQLNLSTANQAGYSDKLSSQQDVSVSAAPSATAQPRGDAMARPLSPPAGLTPPLQSSRTSPASAAADIFLSSRPAHRPGANAERGERRGVARKVRMKQIDVEEVAALNRAKAEEAAAPAAQAAVQASDAQVSTALSHEAQPPAAREAAGNGVERHDSTPGDAQPEGKPSGGWRIPSLADYTGGGGAAATAPPRRPQSQQQHEDRHEERQDYDRGRVGDADNDSHSRWQQQREQQWHDPHEHHGQGDRRQRSEYERGDWGRERSGSGGFGGGGASYGDTETQYQASWQEQPHQQQPHQRQQQQGADSEPESGEVEAEEGELAPSPAPSPAKRPRTNDAAEWL